MEFFKLENVPNYVKVEKFVFKCVFLIRRLDVLDFLIVDTRIPKDTKIQVKNIALRRQEVCCLRSIMMFVR